VKVLFQIRLIFVLLWPFELQAAQDTYEEAVRKLREKAKTAMNGPAMVEIGDNAIRLSVKFPKKRQEAIDLSSEWYGQAWPLLDDFWRSKLRERLARLYVPVVQGRLTQLPVGWGGAIDGKSKAEIVRTRVHSGGSAVRLKPPGNGGLSSVLRSPSVVIPKNGKELEISAWLLTDGTDHPGDGFAAHIAAPGRIIQTLVFAIGSDTPIWTRVVQKTQVPDGENFVNLDFVLGSTKGFFFVDDVSIKLDGKELLTSGGFER